MIAWCISWTKRAQSRGTCLS